jgi:hypothetical protein
MSRRCRRHSDPTATGAEVQPPMDRESMMMMMMK